MMSSKQEMKHLVKRLARFLGLEVARKRVFGFKTHTIIRDRKYKNLVGIRGYPANCLSWENALCKFLGAECFQVFTEPEGDAPEAEVLQVDNPFFGMTPEVARLRLDLLAPEKEKEKEEDVAHEEKSC